MPPAGGEAVVQGTRQDAVASSWGGGGGHQLLRLRVTPGKTPTPHRHAPRPRPPGCGGRGRQGPTPTGPPASLCANAAHSTSPTATRVFTCSSPRQPHACFSRCPVTSFQGRSCFVCFLDTGDSGRGDRALTVRSSHSQHRDEEEEGSRAAPCGRAQRLRVDGVAHTCRSSSETRVGRSSLVLLRVPLTFDAREAAGTHTWSPENFPRQPAVPAANGAARTRAPRRAGRSPP